PDIPRSIPLVMIVAACATAVVVRRRDGALIACVVVGFAAGGQALAADAWNTARSSTLRTAFDDAAAIERANAEAEHRIVPEEASVFAVIEGVLRADAAVARSGVSLSIDVRRVAPLATPGSVIDVSGGVLVGVAGSLTADRIGQWRAGRRIRLPATLHRPARYLDTGVPDGERALLLRGTVLVGNAKSGALVDVVSHAGWIDERLADVRAFSRR